MCVFVLRFAVVIGSMPGALVEEWERWDQQHKSENDHPSMVVTHNKNFTVLFIIQGYSRLINCLYCLCPHMEEPTWNILRYKMVEVIILIY